MYSSAPSVLSGRKLTSWTDSSTNPATTVTVGYDGDGRRITKTSSVSGTTVYVYDPAGDLAVEYRGAAASANGPVYLTTDHLGSTRLATNAGGCVAAHDYLPFGEEVPGGVGAVGGALLWTDGYYAEVHRAGAGCGEWAG